MIGFSNGQGVINWEISLQLQLPGQKRERKVKKKGEIWWCVEQAITTATRKNKASSSSW